MFAVSSNVDSKNKKKYEKSIKNSLSHATFSRVDA